MLTTFLATLIEVLMGASNIIFQLSQLVLQILFANNLGDIFVQIYETSNMGSMFR